MGYRRSGNQSELGFQELVRQDLKTKNYRPLYVLSGDDSHRKESVIDRMKRDAVNPASVAFNYHVLQGDQVDIARVLQLARALPMMGGVQLIWVKNADACLTTKESQEAFIAYLQRPVKETILILTATRFDGRKKWVKSCRSAGFWFDFSPPTGDALVSWVLKSAKRENLPLTREQAELLCELVGNDLLSIKGEISKLALLAEDRGGEVSTEEIGQVIMDQAALDGYEITNALAPGRAGQVLHTWFRLAEWGKTAYEIAPLLVSRVRKGQILAAGRAQNMDNREIAALSGQNPYSLRYLEPMARAMGTKGLSRNLRVALDCERRLKGSPLAPSIIMEKLIFELCEDSSD